MKHVVVQLVIYIEYDAENNNKDPEFQVDVYVKISKYKNAFVKDDTSKVFFFSKELKIYFTMTSDLKKLFGHLIKRKGDELQVKWKGYINLKDAI